MRVRSYIGLIAAFAAVVIASHLTHLNQTLLYEPFRLTGNFSVPLFLILAALFAGGLLPAATAMLVQKVKEDLAARRARRAGREAKSLSAIFRRAVDLQADTQWGKASAELATFLKDSPEDFSALLRYGEVLRRLGRPDEAVDVHRRAAVLYPQSVALLYQLAEDYEAHGEAEVAREIRGRVLRDFPGLGLLEMHRRRGRALAAKDWPEASRLQAAIESMLQEAGDRLGLEAEAGTNQGLAYQRGVGLLEADHVEDAEAVFRQLRDKERRFIPAWIMLGEAALVRGDEEGALREWRGGYDATGSPVFLQRVEDHFIENDEPAQAIEWMRGLIATTESSLMPRFYLGRLYYRLEMHEEALRVLAGVEERVKTSPTYRFLLARIHERRGEMARAVENYLESLHELGLHKADFICRSCRARFGEWSDRCDACGSWNSIELNFEEEQIQPAQAGIREVPVWGSAEDSGSWPASPVDGRAEE